ncbi:magnesium transporter [Haliea sp. E1-2-M8]|uniref:magnesium transporter n=1 Tax=Haliea sp. E1-2-M8 TaxID=3064706 RepID=UPI002716C668|nr:magnesium transporter [Haliea sp. E1-2-M8]MDO8861283.1 magnesium transporter [Haliea sp. E1-2-M8]
MTSNQSPAALAEEIREASAADAAELLQDMPPEQQQQVLAVLPPDQALAIASHLGGPPAAVGEGPVELEYMGQVGSGESHTVEELLVAPAGVLGPETTVAGALDYLVQANTTATITYIYVAGAEGRLLGTVAMRDLLLGRPGQRLAEIMTPEPFAFTRDTLLPEAIQQALRRRHRIYPAVDEEGRLLGLVYGWQLFERMASELSLQTGSMVGLSREERVGTGIWSAFRMRHPWLQVNLLTAFAAAFVVGIFEETITQIVALAVFLPVLAGQSGNTGCQALAITLRGMTVGEIAEIPVSRLLRKEMALGAMNGFVVGCVAAIAMWAYASMSGADNPLVLGLVILVAMVGACVGSGIFGVMVPLTLRRFGADPATASSIFLTTFTDILGMGLMLFLATALLL